MHTFKKVAAPYYNIIIPYEGRSSLLQYHYTLWRRLMKYWSQRIITKAIFAYSSVTKLICEMSIYNMSICEKIHLFKYISRNGFLFIRITLNNWQKLTFFFHLFSKCLENVIWSLKVKSTIFTKIFFRKTLYSLCIEIDNTGVFWRGHNRFWKNNYINYKTSWI